MTANKIIATHSQVPALDTPSLPILRTPGFFAKWPIIGVLMFVFGSLLFAAFTANLLAQGPLLVWDKLLANTLPAIGLRSPAIVKSMMIAGFYIGKEVIVVLDILLAIYFLYKRFWQELAMVVVGWTGSALIFYALSTLISRARPSTQIWIVVNIPGFPSGHAISVVVFYGLLAYLVAPKMPTAFGKWAVIAAALLIIGFVGFSRIFTGGHYLTDILSGYAVGIAWSGVVYPLIEIISKNRKVHHVQKE